ncbi:TauD/TfdA family dioxygenase [Bdellovibrio bacteriovorus]|uniref:TauD/TfdA dioxygenase family protein n=1 Tax=Bdellovibrio bacteriovorus TaxID=959 RepID=UPI0021D2FE02|nr:TauD/TfdA family dioxygenase [Bdellovibrio bacteriovorus]UXR65304.1 TauD/TfdA family dioxygenase [Bdellovibrio bacteriovorus]
MKQVSLNPFGMMLVSDDHTTGLAQLSIATVKELLHQHKLVVIRGISAPARDQFLAFCAGISEMRPLEWSFGPVMEMKEDQNPQNYLFSREKVPFHWDGAFHQVPDYLVFSCVQAPNEAAGGETLFTNTEPLYQEASEEIRNHWALLELQYQTDKKAHYGGSIKAPLVQKHPITQAPILRFAEPVETELNPVSLKISGGDLSLHPHFLSDMVQKIYAAEYCYKHQWQAGDLLFADNHSLIHGRTAFEKNCPRHLRRIQLIKETSL